MCRGSIDTKLCCVVSLSIKRLAMAVGGASQTEHGLLKKGDAMTYGNGRELRQRNETQDWYVGWGRQTTEARKFDFGMLTHTQGYFTCIHST